MTVIADTSFLYALYNENDTQHLYARRSGSVDTMAILIPCFALPELTYLFMRDTGYRGVETFLEHFKYVSSQLVPLVQQDLYMIHEFATNYASA